MYFLCVSVLSKIHLFMNINRCHTKAFWIKKCYVLILNWLLQSYRSSFLWKLQVVEWL